jgi:hypothetical protein
MIVCRKDAKAQSFLWLYLGFPLRLSAFAARIHIKSGLLPIQAARN